MQSLRKTTTWIAPNAMRFARLGTQQLGEPGCGAGKGGGGGGAIRSAGGAFGRMEVAHEEEFFYNQRKEQLHKLKEKLIQQEEYHHESIKQHEDAIERHKKAIDALKNAN